MSRFITPRLGAPTTLNVSLVTSERGTVQVLTCCVLQHPEQHNCCPPYALNTRPTHEESELGRGI